MLVTKSGNISRVSLTPMGFGVKDVCFVDLGDVAVVKIYPTTVPSDRVIVRTAVRRVIYAALLRSVMRRGATLWEFIAIGKGFAPLCIGFAKAYYRSKSRYLFMMCNSMDAYCKLYQHLAKWAPEVTEVVTPVKLECAGSSRIRYRFYVNHPIKWMDKIEMYVSR